MYIIHTCYSLSVLDFPLFRNLKASQHLSVRLTQNNTHKSTSDIHDSYIWPLDWIRTGSEKCTVELSEYLQALHDFDGWNAWLKIRILKCKQWYLHRKTNFSLGNIILRSNNAFILYAIKIYIKFSYSLQVLLKLSAVEYKFVYWETV